ncbi:MAG: RluA family pseudouridine synthase [Clostridia bacterium]|nr:RluA family pseudouridine synthase [Clostridia bacterium]MDE7328318.1 RluA family pseudouridine synthase [Clostridia bacterium]
MNEENILDSAEDFQVYAVGEDGVGFRLDVFLNDKTGASRSHIKSLIERSKVFVNGGAIKKAGYSLKFGDEVTVYEDEVRELNVKPQNIPIDIIYEDDDIAVINKAQGMVVHPAAGSYENTLVNALLYHLKSLSGINGVIRPGIVHRLDKDTSGLLVVAKNDEAHINLQEQIASKSAKRFYYALIDGKASKDEGIIETLIDRSQKDRKLMAVSRSGGRNAITLYKVLERFERYTLMEYELKTGRTHQIRVHSKHIGHPVVGDLSYGGSNKFGLKGQLLHAHKLVLSHPKTGELMTFEAPLPEYFESVLIELRIKAK